MEKTFKSCDRKQMLLLPPSLLDWLPEGHLAHFILDTVEHLDLSKIYSSYQGDGRGHPPYDPRMMSALLFYAYCTGVRSSRRIEKRTHEDVAFRVIAANRHPDHDSICEFSRVLKKDLDHHLTGKNSQNSSFRRKPESRTFILYCKKNSGFRLSPE